MKPGRFKIHLCLLAGGRLESALEGLDPRWPCVAQEIGDDTVAARIAAFLHPTLGETRHATPRPA